MNKRSGLIIFAKKPVLGQVKTRLQPQITPEISLEINRYFVETTLAKFSHLSKISFWLGCYPNQEDPWFSELSQKYPVQLFNQEGDDLGARMERAFELLNHKKIVKKVIVGTDSPHLPLHFIQSAFEYLESVPAVIGPSRDGGYYLLGISGDPPALFDGIRWSTDSVLAGTIRKLKEKNVPFRLLPEWFDIDQFEDLCSLLAYWKDLKNNGGEIPENFFHYLNGLDSVTRSAYVSTS